MEPGLDKVTGRQIAEDGILPGKALSAFAFDRPPPVLDEKTFRGFRNLFLQLIGIHLPDTKRQLVSSRLSRRVADLGLGGFGDYLKLLEGRRDRAEIQLAIDLITTNETWFFREMDHFTLLAEKIVPALDQGQCAKVWCGAAATGEEPYSIAMVLQDKLGPGRWSLVATDINTKVLAAAAEGIYPIDKAKSIPEGMLKRHCLRGIGENQGTFRIREELRSLVRFRRTNLLSLDADLQDLDIVFLRNVLIYFDAPERQRILQEVSSRMRPGAWLLLGHSESAVGLKLPLLECFRPSIHRRRRNTPTNSGGNP